MDSYSVDILLVFVLAFVPGVLVLEIYEYRRPALRERDRTRTLARYLLLSVSVWALAALGLDADGDVVRFIETGAGEGDELVRRYRDLALELLATAAVLGAGFVVVRSAAERIGSRLARVAEAQRKGRALKAGVWLASGISGQAAWDRLLANVRRAEIAQIACVRLQDCREVYGLFASAGRADYDADGRGLLLDAELVVGDEGLTKVPGSSGVFIAPDAITSVSFVDVGDPSGAKLDSTLGE